MLPGDGRAGVEVGDAVVVGEAVGDAGGVEAAREADAVAGGA